MFNVQRTIACALVLFLGVTHASVPTSYAQETYQATHYGTSYQGRTMANGQPYDTNNTRILAVPPSMYSVPMGTRFTVTGPAGSIEVERTDSCPGCDTRTPRLLDLSEAGIIAVCGSLGSCYVTLQQE